MSAPRTQTRTARATRAARAARATRALGAALGALGVALGLGGPGCRQVLGGHEFVDQVPTAAPPVPTPPPPVKVDLLIEVQSSFGMSDKLDVLARSVADLVGGLVRPPCVGAQGDPVPNQPETATAPCPAGSTRLFEPIRDLHVGVISSSLGVAGPSPSPYPVHCLDGEYGHRIDGAHLLDRDAEGGTVPTYQGAGYLAWDPDAQLDPPGIASQAELASSVETLLLGVGAKGCGLESQLEAWYRFLIEPAPYEALVAGPQGVEPSGLDEALLAEREAFLRPDSKLVIVMVGAQNDCSFIPRSWLLINTPLREPRPECAEDPDDACCAPCNEEPPGCPPVAGCGPLAPQEDNANLRCFDTKRRFGLELLYPVERYAAALRDAELVDDDGLPFESPLFAGGRSPDDVLLVTIGGVPWQDIARRSLDGTPDLLAGVDLELQSVGGVQSAAELEQNGTWALMLGDAASATPPQDPLMRESVEPRSGSHPITNEPLGGPDAGPTACSIHGHEKSEEPGELQYACLYELPAPLPACVPPTAHGDPSCSTSCMNGEGAQWSDPACQHLSTGAYEDQQFRGAVFPTPRQLKLARALGDRAFVGSACPKQLDDPSPGRLDYGYRAVIAALLSSLAKQ